MTETKSQRSYFVVTAALKFKDFQEVRSSAPDLIARHVTRSKELHKNGTLLMSGAFLDKTEDHMSTMAVLTSREAAEDYIREDPFYGTNMVEKWTVREWANMFA